MKINVDQLRTIIKQEILKENCALTGGDERTRAEKFDEAAKFATKVWKELKKLNPPDVEADVILEHNVNDYIVYAMVVKNNWDNIKLGPKAWAEKYLEQVQRWKERADIAPSGVTVVPQAPIQFF